MDLRLKYDGFARGVFDPVSKNGGWGCRSLYLDRSLHFTLLLTLFHPILEYDVTSASFIKAHNFAGH